MLFRSSLSSNGEIVIVQEAQLHADEIERPFLGCNSDPACLSKEWKVHLNRCSHSSRQRLRTWLISGRIRIKRDQMEA